MVYQSSFKAFVCIICNLILITILYIGYNDVNRKQKIIKTQSPISVKVLEINRGRSRASSMIKFNNKVYKNVALPSDIKQGSINETNFYYDNSKNEVFSTNIGENALNVGLVLFIFSLLLWFVPKKYFKV